MLWNIPKILEKVSAGIPKWFTNYITNVFQQTITSSSRSSEFKEDDAIWKGGEDGGVGGGGPPPSGMGATGPTGGYVAK